VSGVRYCVEEGAYDACDLVCSTNAITEKRRILYIPETLIHLMTCITRLGPTFADCAPVFESSHSRVMISLWALKAGGMQDEQNSPTQLDVPHINIDCIHIFYKV
jgi:hypothetical protein